MRSALFAFMLALLGGCASVAELRQRPPDREAVLQGRYDLMAACVAAKIDQIPGQGQPPTLRVDAANSTARLFKLIDKGDSALYDLLFVQVGQEQVRLEARSVTTIFGSGHHLAALWPAVDQCAAAL